MKRKLRVNGTLHNVDVAPDTPLLWVLRDTLGLTGTKYACGVMACGACTVLVDGEARRTCAVPISAFSEHQAITTIEGLAADDGTVHPLQKAWVENSVSQCGYCQSGMILAAAALLGKNPDPGDEDIAREVNNICRCGTYQLVRLAIRQAAGEMRRG